MRVHSTLLVLATIFALGGCGGGDSGDSRVDEVVQITEEAKQVHQQALTAGREARRCSREAGIDADASEKAWFDAVEEEAAKLTDDQRQSMADLRDAVRCAQENIQQVERSNRELERLTRELESFDPQVIEEAGDQVSL